MGLIHLESLWDFVGLCGPPYVTLFFINFNVQSKSEKSMPTLVSFQDCQVQNYLQKKGTPLLNVFHHSF
jgi:hypothetical protein